MATVESEIVEGCWDVDNEEYDADTSCVSSSSLKEFLDWVPTYHQRYVLGTLPRREPSESMTLGSAIHCAILEPEKYRDQYCTAPVCDRRTKEGKATWAEFCEGNADKIILTADQDEAVQGARKAVNAHAIRPYIESALVERAYRWINRRTGVWCKCRPDAQSKYGEYTIDLKTVSSLSEKKLMSQAADLRYHMQAALYIDGINEVTDGNAGAFLHVAILTTPPYGVVVYRLGEVSIQHGREMYQDGLKRLVECRMSGDWSDPKERGVNLWELPRWAMMQESY